MSQQVHDDISLQTVNTNTSTNTKLVQTSTPNHLGRNTTASLFAASGLHFEQYIKT